VVAASAGFALPGVQSGADVVVRYLGNGIISPVNLLKVIKKPSRRDILVEIALELLGALHLDIYPRGR
jgi:hypothetical protein